MGGVGRHSASVVGVGGCVGRYVDAPRIIAMGWPRAAPRVEEAAARPGRCPHRNSPSDGDPAPNAAAANAEAVTARPGEDESGVRWTARGGAKRSGAWQRGVVRAVRQGPARRWRWPAAAAAAAGLVPPGLAAPNPPPPKDGVAAPPKDGAAACWPHMPESVCWIVTALDTARLL